MHPVSQGARSVRHLLLQEHLQLDVLLDCLLAAVDAHATDEVRCLQAAFDARLRAHLEFEERYLIPEFAQSHPEESRRLLAEHARLREALLQLGVALERHLPRATDVFGRFGRLLRLHAAREAQLLYPWAEQNIGADASSKLLERFS